MFAVVLFLGYCQYDWEKSLMRLFLQLYRAIDLAKCKPYITKQEKTKIAEWRKK